MPILALLGDFGESNQTATAEAGAYDGKLVRENLLEERVAPDEVYAELRKAGLEDLSQVKWAMLETDGEISIVPAKQPPGVPGKRKRGEVTA